MAKDYKSRVMIDLSEFGSEGIVEMGMPLFTARLEKSICLESRIPRDAEGRPDRKAANMTEIGLIEVLSYVRKAPFERTPEAFGEFMDKLDEDQGTADELWTRIQDAYSKLSKGEVSPLQDSTPSETTSSD